MLRWKFAVATALAVTAIAGPAAVAADAQTATALATCSGTGCDDKDPNDTGCSATASSVPGSGFRPYNGYLEMRFGNCATNWARFTVSENGHYAIWVQRQASSGIPAREGRHYEFDGTTTGGPYWSDQLYAPNVPLTKARVCVTRRAYPWWDNAQCSGWF
ncbi:hypothetical protein [Nonomuraea sp. NPDC049784]|uniref:hypothetical protein n=1 Tax=Nonomuraea sp. NPDC049784 TaxID=3154361 RepID=UPI0033F995E2